MAQVTLHHRNILFNNAGMRGTTSDPQAEKKREDIDQVVLEVKNTLSTWSCSATHAHRRCLARVTL